MRYIDARDRLVQNRSRTNSITVRNLRPFRNYTITIVTVAGDDLTTQRRSRPVSASFQTKESVPGSLTVFEPEVRLWLTLDE